MSQLTINGFHRSSSGRSFSADLLRQLDAAGISFMDKRSDAMPMDGQLIAQQSAVPHYPVFRRSVSPDTGPPPSGNPDTPDYGKDPATAAAEHWAWHIANLPPELDPAYTIIETVNEPAQAFVFQPHEEAMARALLDGRFRSIAQRPADGAWVVDNSRWMMAFCIETARLALRDGYRWAGPGWSPGEPEIEAWRTVEGLAFLELLAANHGRLYLALHEYSLDVANIEAKFGWHMCRYRHVLAACDAAGIGRPQILMTEWGWTYNDVPEPVTAVNDILTIGAEYAKDGAVVGAAIWALNGPGWNGIADRAVQIVPGWHEEMMTITYPDPDPTPPPAGGSRGAPRDQYRRVYWVLPQDIDEATYTAVARLAMAENLRTVGFSYDDAGIGDLDSRTAVLWGIPADQRQVFSDWYATHYPGVAVEFRELPGAPPPPPTAPFAFTHWPTEYRVITQAFGKNPDYYAQFGLPGHEGVDIRAAHGSNLYAVADGRVYRVETVEAAGGNYGIQVRIQHPGGFSTVYAHMLDTAVAVGDVVQGGDVIGRADNTGNSFGDHLHLTLKSDRAYAGGPDYIGYPGNIIDPTPYLLPLLDAPPPAAYHYSGPAVRYRSALHGPASDWMWNMPELRAMLAQVAMPLKYLSNGINADHFQAQPWHLVRAFWQPERAKSPAECWQDIGGDLVRLYGRGARRFELLNEPNLPGEGLGVVWADGAAFGHWLREFILLARPQLPEAQFYFPGLSPGVPYTNQVTFTNAAWPQVRDLCAGFCLHAYTGTTDNVNTAVAEVVDQVTALQAYYNLQVPLVVSECSVNRRAGDEFRAAVYEAIDAKLAQVPGVEAAVWYVSHWSPEMDANYERWLDTRLPLLYRPTR